MKIITDDNFLPSRSFIETLSMLFFPEDGAFGKNSATGNYISLRLDRNREKAAAECVIFYGGESRFGEYTDKSGRPDLSGKDFLNDLAGRAVFCAAEKFALCMPPWGIHTGIRPARSAERAFGSAGSLRAAAALLREKYLMSPEKAELCCEVFLNAKRILGGGYADSVREDEYSLYISVPFCPTRCVYCSFTSFSGPKLLKTVEPYLEKLTEELKLISSAAKAKRLKLKTIYVGGGTPTFLSESQIKKLLEAVAVNFSPCKADEFTVEAGRPDTVTEKKLRILKDFGVNRISINPQTINERTLKLIGRAHTPGDFFAAYEAAEKIGFKSVNTDLIAGLPGETEGDTLNTARAVISLAPANITVHTLAKKRSAKIKEGGFPAGGSDTAKTLAAVYSLLKSEGYAPYYLYKQKFTVANLENTGFSKKGAECMYNIYMMDEIQTVFGAGAGAMTKIISGGRIERIANYKYPFEYLANGFPLASQTAAQKLSLLNLPTEE